MAGDLAELHLGDDGPAQRRRLPPPGRAPERGGEHPDLGHAPAQRLPVDPADVPLQRVVLPVDGRGELGHERVPAQGGRSGDLPADPGRRGHALLRGPRRAQPADQRPRGVARGHRPGVCHGGRRRAAGRDDRGHGAAGVRCDPRLRADRNLRARRGVRQARGLGQPGDRRAGAAERPAGGAVPAPRRDDGHRPRRRHPRASRRPDPRRDRIAATSP